jgi:uncharacterized membrane protein
MGDKDGMPGRTRTIIVAVIVAALIVFGAVDLFIEHDANAAAHELLTAALFGLSALIADVWPTWQRTPPS